MYRAEVERISTLRRRTLRDVGTVAGVLVIIAVMVVFNMFDRMGDLRAKSIAWRKSVEDSRRKSGLEILEWPVLQNTKGTLSSGPTFDPALIPHKDNVVNLVGFMVPLYEFRNAHEFILLPMPIECYFCQMPPARDVVFVQMAEGEQAKMVQEPVMIHGRLNLNEGPGTKFFYAVREAKWGPGEIDSDRELTPLEVKPEHIAHSAVKDEKEEPLLEGSEPPAAAQPGGTAVQPETSAPETGVTAPPADASATPPAPAETPPSQNP